MITFDRFGLAVCALVVVALLCLGLAGGYALRSMRPLDEPASPCEYTLASVRIAERGAESLQVCMETVEELRAALVRLLRDPQARCTCRGGEAP